VGRGGRGIGRAVGRGGRAVRNAEDKYNGYVFAEEAYKRYDS